MSNSQKIKGTLGPRITILAPAKINLFLNVVGRSSNGYHLLNSMVAFASIHDRVTVIDNPSFLLELRGPFAKGLESDSKQNLVEKAVISLSELLGIKPNVHILLEKNLPLAAGIGGGSADAAAIIKALIQLWDIKLDSCTLKSLALSIGADVPMCLFGKTCFVGGIGDKVSPAPSLPHCPVLLANPGVGLSTADVFKAKLIEFSVPPTYTGSASSVRELAQALSGCDNDLQNAAIFLKPEIEQVLETLDSLPGSLISRMSGSGATCFALFETDALALEGVNLLRRQHPTWWTSACILLP